MSRQAETWIMVRLPRTLHAQLTALAELWSQVYARGGQALQPDEEGRIAIHRVIAQLLDRDARHRARSRKKVLREHAG